MNDSEEMNDPDNQTKTITAAFDISEWRPTEVENPETPSELTKVRVQKRFAGEVSGTSTALMLMVGNAIGAGYVGSEVFVGSVAGREGSFVFQHWGVAEGTASLSDGYVVPGSGTDELAEIRGNVKISQDAEGQHYITLTITL